MVRAPRFLLSLALVVVTGCASHPAGTPAAAVAEDAAAATKAGDFERARKIAEHLELRGEGAAALSIRIALADLTHDRQAMTALLHHPALSRLRNDVEARARLASALALTVGVTAAKADLEAVCAASSLPVGSRQRVDACSMAAVADMAAGRERTFAGEENVELDFLPKVPIPIVMLAVNELPPAPFVIDTGAAGVALSKAYCDQHGIAYRRDAARITHDASGADIPIFPTWLDSLDAKGLRAVGVDAIVIELPPNLRVGGIVGPHRAFAGALVELDLRADKLRIRRSSAIDAWAKELAEPVRRAPLVWDDGNVFVRARLDDRLSGFMNFDTGAAGSVVPLETATALGRTIDRARATDSVSITRHASFPSFSATLAVGDETAVVREALTPIERKGSDHTRIGPIGNVGITWMRGRRIAISPDGRTLAYTAATR